MRIFALFAVFSSLLVGCSQNSEGLQYFEDKVDSLSKVLKVTQDVYRSSYSLRLDRINPSIEIVDPELDTFHLGHVVENTNRLYFHFSDLHCSPCLAKELQRLKQFEIFFGSEFLCILGSVQSYRSIVSLINNYHFDCDIFIVPIQKSILINSPNFTEPYYFTLLKDGRIDFFHFPMVEDSTSTTYFLEVCQQMLDLNSSDKE